MWKYFKKIPIIESFRAFLEQWGLWHYFTFVGGSMTALSVALWSWLESHLPYWGIFAVFLAVLAVFMLITNKIHSIVLRQKSRSIDIPESAAWIKGVVREMRQTLAEQRAVQQQPTRHQGETEQDFSMREFRQRLDTQRNTASSFYGKHGGELIAAFRIVETLSEQEAPFHTKTSISSEPMSAVAFIDAAAHIMESGATGELAKLDDKFMFFLGGR